MKKVLGLLGQARMKLSLVCMMAALAAVNAFAFNYDGTDNTQIFWDMYDFIFRMVTGAPAYAFCLVGVCVGGYMLWKSQIVGALGVFAAVICIVKAPAILGTLGYVFC